MRRIASRAWANVGFICVAVMLVYCVVHAFDPPRLNWGDSASDYNVMTSGRNFAQYGFLKLRLTPIVLDAGYMSPSDSALVYTHYPQLPDLMNGVERVVFGFTDLVQFRFVALAFSFGSLFFIYQLVCAFWSRRAAQIALGLWVINPLWIQHADYLHHAPYAAFFGFGSLYFLARYLRESRAWLLAAGGLFMFLVFMASYDFWIFVPLLAAAIVVARDRRVTLGGVRTLSILAACAVAALAFKWGTNAWALGGVAGFLHDLRFQLTERATKNAVRVAYTHAIWPTLIGRVDRSFSLLLFPIAAFWALLPVLRRRFPALAARPIANPIVLLVAALPFLMLFTELWVGQYYPALLVVPFYAVACAVLVTMAVESTTRHWRLVGFVLVAALATNSISENVRFKKAFLPRGEIASLQKELDAVAQPKQHVLVDHVFDAAYRYYFHRNTVALILNPPEHYPDALKYYTDAKRPVVAPPTGAVFIQDKHLADELYDKGYYYILGRQGLWGPWGNPERYRDELDQYITKRDSELVAAVAGAGGQKVQETDSYVVWRIMPHAPDVAATAATAGPRQAAGPSGAQ